MSITLATSYRRLVATKFPGMPPTYERLVEAMVQSVALGKPEGHLLKEIKTLEAEKMGVWPLREQPDRMYQTYLALCSRTRKVPVITEQIVVGIYLHYLSEELGAPVRDLASDADLETLYTAAKFAAARESRRTTHPLLRDTRGLSLPGGDAAGLLMISGESAGSAGPVWATREPRIPAATVDREIHRRDGGFYGDGSGPPASDRRRGGFPDRPARPLMMPPRVPPRPYTSRARFGFEDAQGRDQETLMSRNRAAERRYSSDPRPARWPQVHVVIVQPSPQEPSRTMGPSYHNSTSRRIFDPPPSTGTSGWNPCFACGQTGHRLTNCTKYLQECARDPLRANRCPACSAVGLCPADCRRRLYFATSSYPHLELNKNGTSYFIRCGLPMPRWYRPELLVGPARAVTPAMSNPSVPEYRAAYAVRAAALPHTATPAVPAPPAPTPTSVPTEKALTRCVQHLTWSPGVFVMDPSSAERVIATAPRPVAAALGDDSQAIVPLPTPLLSAVSGHAEGIAEGGKPGTGVLSLSTAADPGSSCGARVPGVRAAAADLGGSAAPGAASGAVNMMIARRDTGSAAQARGPKKDARASTPRCPPQGCKPAHTRAVALLDGLRCVVIVDTGADVSLVSARALCPGVRPHYGTSAAGRCDIGARGFEGTVGPG